MQSEAVSSQELSGFDEGRLLEGLEEVVGTFPQEVTERGINRYWKQLTFLLKRLGPFWGRLPQEASVCDIGAGPGIVPLVVARMGFKVSLIDRWSEYGPKFDNQMGFTDDFYARFRRYGARYYCCDFLCERIPLPDESQDFVSAYSVLEHLSRPRVFLDEVWRLLKPGGYVAILVPNTANLQNRIRLLLGGSPHTHHWKEYYGEEFFGHYRELTRSELREIFEKEGYGIELLCTSNASQTNTKEAGGKWGRGWKLKSASQLIRGLYLLVVALVPAFRYDMLLVARKPTRHV